MPDPNFCPHCGLTCGKILGERGQFSELLYLPFHARSQESSVHFIYPCHPQQLCVERRHPSTHANDVGRRGKVDNVCSATFDSDRPMIQRKTIVGSLRATRTLAHSHPRKRTSSASSTYPPPLQQLYFYISKTTLLFLAPLRASRLHHGKRVIFISI